MSSITRCAVIAHILPVRQRDFRAPDLRPPRSQPLRRHLRLAQRSDTDSAAIIEEGLKHLMLRGREAAINYLCEQGIALRTISRVLFQPQLRRGD